MTDERVILITGVSGYWGGKLARRLIEMAISLNESGSMEEVSGLDIGSIHIIGIDVVPPAEEIKGLDFIQADLRNPLLVELLSSESVHTVCHLAFKETRHPTEQAFDLNVIGTMKLIGACAEVGVQKAVLKSSTEIYGASPNNPAFLTEQHPLNGKHSVGTVRDYMEIEAFCNGFRRQVPELAVTTLRFPSIIGPTADTPMSRFLKQPLAPVLMGFDPLTQIIHESDVIDAMIHAIINDVPGVFNVADEGILPLQKLMALAGKLPVPIFHLFAYWGVNLFGNMHWPIDLDYIRYPWVADLDRMREELCFVPQYTSEEALREFAGQQRLRRYMPESVAKAYDEERLRDTIERRRRIREQKAVHATELQEDVDNERPE